MKKTRVGIGLVHNQNYERLDSLIPQLKNLRNKLSPHFEIEYKEYYWQPQLTNHDTLTVLNRDFKYFTLERRWRNYRKINNRNIILDFSAFFIRFLRKTRNQKKYKITSFIETLVSNKHINLWSKLAENNDIVLIFEDDVVLNENSINSFCKLLLSISEKKMDEKYLYVDLAGGCELEDLKLDNLKLSHQNELTKYTKLVTNTACGYMISSSLLELFLKELILKPEYRYIGIDWMMNQLSMNLEELNIEVECYHCHPPIFQHGSFTGEYLPWQR